MPSATDSGLELLTSVQRGDKAAFARLYDLYSAALHGVITRILGEGEQAEEVLQDSFMKIWRSANKYDPVKGRVFTWMLNIARNSAIDVVRSADHRDSGMTQGLDKAVYRLGTDEDRTRHDHLGVNDVVGKLKPEHQEMIDMAYYQGWSQQEIADRTGLPLGTVKSRTRTALQVLKEALKDHA
jgi:RNA polymerase sigma-70 factor (ECF subfamily)